MNIDLPNKIIWELGALSAAIAASISSIFILFNGWRERKSAEKRHIRELAMQTATAAFKHQEWAFEHIHDKSSQMHFLPFDYFFIHYLNLATVLGTGKALTKSEFAKRVAEIDSLRPDLRKWAMELPKSINA